MDQHDLNKRGKGSCKDYFCEVSLKSAQWLIRCISLKQINYHGRHTTNDAGEPTITIAHHYTSWSDELKIISEIKGIVKQQIQTQS